MCERVAAGGVADEDERSADLLNLLRVEPREALVVGCGMGAVVSALAARGARVTAVDHSEERLSFVRARAEEAGRKIETYQAREPLDLRPAEAFDLIAYLDPRWHGALSADRLAESARSRLHPGGQVLLRGSGLRAPGIGGTAPRGTAGALRRRGFVQVEAYASLPGHGVPLFQVPILPTSALRYFVDHILPLALSAPAATRRRYGLAARLARLAPRVSRIPFAIALAEFAVPSWLIVGRLGGISTALKP